MLRNINKTGHTIKMMWLVLISQVEKTEILLLLENVVKCLQFTFGILILWALSLHSILEPVLKVLLLYLSVHVKDMLLLLIKVMIIPCISIMSKERRCFSPFQLGLTQSLIFSGLKNQMTSNLLLSLLDLFNSGIQLTLVKNCIKMVHSDQNSHKQNSIVRYLMRMVFAIPVVPMVEFMYGIKNKILV